MRETEIVPLLSCTKNIASHESAFKFTGPEDEFLIWVDDVIGYIT